jgi:signal transduction histidine kinase
MTPGSATVPRTWGTAAAASALMLLGVASVRIGFATFQVQLAFTVLTSGWIVATLGFAAWRGAPWSRCGAILVLVSAAWFVGPLRWVAWDPLAAAAAWLSLLWVGILGHALLTYPTGRAGGRLVALAVGATYLAAVVPSAAQETLAAAILATGLVVTRLARDRRHRSGGWGGVTVGLVFCLVLASYRQLPTVLGRPGLDPQPLLQLALMVTAAALATGLLRQDSFRGRVTDLVVELGAGPGGGLSSDLARAIGDPTLQVGLWLSDETEYVDITGAPFRPAAAQPGRSVTPIDIDGRRVAILVHDAVLAADPQLRAAIARAAGLSSANAALQADLRTQVMAVRASRARLLTASDDERASMERRLRAALEPRLARLEARLMVPELDGVPGTTRIMSEVREVRRDLVELAEGISPRLLEEHGLAGAMLVLAGRCPVPVVATLTVGQEPVRPVQTCLLFVASEALTNVARHARATSVHLRLALDAALVTLVIVDDGHGGADPRAGSGLTGLRDRVETLGGRMTLADMPGGGTRLWVGLPMAGQLPQVLPI